MVVLSLLTSFLKVFEGDEDQVLVGSLILSVVRGLEFRIAFVSVINVTSDSSSKDLP